MSWIFGIGALAGYSEPESKAKPALAALTTVAALPSAGGCMASLPPEVAHRPKLTFPKIVFLGEEPEC